MKKFVTEIIQILALWIWITLPGSAETLSSEIIRKGDVVHFGTAISNESYKRLIMMYNNKPFTMLQITSNGGEYDAGMKIAQLVYQKNINVYVPKYCASACTFVFFGAKLGHRDIAPNAMLGLHNVSFDTNASSLDQSIPIRDAMEFAQSAVVRSGMMISFYAANGVPSDVLLKVSQTYGKGIINVQRDDLVRWGSISE